MKNKLKALFLMLGLILIMSVPIGCTQTGNQSGEENVNSDSESVSKENVGISAGFVKDKYVENDNMIVEFGYTKDENDENDEKLLLQTKDNDLFDSIEILDHYMVAYDGDNKLISIESNDAIREIMEGKGTGSIEGEENEEAGAEDDEEFEIISSTESIEIDGLSLLDSYSIDIYGDGEEEEIGMYVDAQEDSEGNIMWDDGQNWKIVVSGNNYNFVLFDGYLQLSSMDFFVYTIDEDFYIATVNSGTANLTMVKYKYNSEDKTFKKTIESDTSGNVNMHYKSTSGI